MKLKKNISRQRFSQIKQRGYATVECPKCKKTIKATTVFITKTNYKTRTIYKSRKRSRIIQKVYLTRDKDIGTHKYKNIEFVMKYTKKSLLEVLRAMQLRIVPTVGGNVGSKKDFNYIKPIEISGVNL